MPGWRLIPPPATGTGPQRCMRGCPGSAGRRSPRDTTPALGATIQHHRPEGLTQLVTSGATGVHGPGFTSNAWRGTPYQRPPRLSASPSRRPCSYEPAQRSHLAALLRCGDIPVCRLPSPIAPLLSPRPPNSLDLPAYRFRALRHPAATWDRLRQGQYDSPLANGKFRCGLSGELMSAIGTT